MADLPLSMRVQAVETGRGRGVKRPRNEDAFRSRGRKDSNAPAEVSSKRRVPVVSEGVTAKGQARARDPRFLATAGQFNETIFRNSYKFLDEMRDDEAKVVRKQIKKAKSKDTRVALQAQLSKLRQANIEGRRGDVARSALSAARAAERKAVATGVKAPFYLKSKAAKQLARDSQMEDLRSRGGDRAVRKFESKRELRKGQRGRSGPKLGGMYDE